MTSQRDLTGIRIGMWLFLYTEIILFGGLFVIYSVYFYDYSAEFAKSGKELNRLIGSLNTIILLVSSFFILSNKGFSSKDIPPSSCKISLIVSS